MKPQLTKEDVENFFMVLDYFGDKSAAEAKNPPSEVERAYYARIKDGIKNAAIAWLDVQPVKIKDLPIDCDSAIGLRSDGLHIIFRYGMDRWSTSAISRLWDEEDYAIPLSAILALKTPDKVT